MKRTSLEEYAAQHGEAEPQELEDLAAQEQARQERQEDIARAQELRERITAALEQGDAPQLILYRAIDCIALLSHDKSWGERAAEQLDSIYGDLLQANLLEDTKAKEAQRLAEQLEEHNQKLRRQLERQLKAQEKITESIKTGLQALGEELGNL